MGAAVEALLARLGSKVDRADRALARPPALSLEWPEVDALLPDGGLPRGVVEIATPRALGGATSFALAAVRAAQRKDSRAWCAWIDPEATLYGPGAARAGIDLSRLLVVRPSRSEIGRVAVKVCASRGLDVVVVDLDPIPFANVSSEAPKKRRTIPEATIVRRLALAAEEAGATVLLLSDANASRAPMPVALRIEMTRTSAADVTMRVAKDRFGRIGLARAVPFRPPRSEEVG
jgi:recombination protein RecA